MPRLSLPAFALTFTCALLACTGGDDDGPGADGGVDPRAPNTIITRRPDALTRQPAARFEFESDQAGSTFTCSLDGGPREACTSPFEVVVIDARHSFNVVATNPDGIADRTPAGHDWTVDTVAPETVLLTVPAPIDNSEHPVFEFIASGDDAGVATFTCQIDNRDPEPCRSPWQPSLPIGKGEHRVEIQATDAAGNVEVDPPSHTWIADLLLPDTVIDGGPSGLVASRTAVFTFSSRNATAPVTYRCRVDQGGAQPCTSPFTIQGLADGGHSFTVDVFDAGGVNDPTPAARGWHIDATPPTVSLTGGPVAGTSDTTPSFTFSVSTDTVARECRTLSSAAPDPAFAPCASPYTSPLLPEGPARVEIRARDAAGNVGTAARDFVVDTVAPSVAILSGPPAIGTDSTPTFQFVTDAADLVECRAGTWPWAACTSPYTSPELIDGNHTFEVRASDVAGNLASASRAFTVDTTAPAITFTGGPQTSSGATADNTPTFTFTVTGAAPGGVSCRIGSVDDYAPCTSPYTSGVVADGSHSVMVRATDSVGNQRVAIRPFTVNAQPMTVTFTSGPIGSDTRDRSPAFTWTTTGAVRTTECRHDASEFGSCYTVMSTDLPDGPHTLEVRLRDDLGRLAGGTVSFTVDTVAPTATVTGGPSGTISTTDVTFTFDTAGAPVVTECRLFRQGQASGAYAPCASPYALTLQPPSSPHPYTFEVRVRDAAGNQWSAYRNFTYSSN